MTIHTTDRTPAPGDTVTITRGTVTRIQTAGCTHGLHTTQHGRRIWTTTHGERPEPARPRLPLRADRAVPGPRHIERLRAELADARTETKTVRDQARADTERLRAELEWVGSGREAGS